MSRYMSGLIAVFFALLGAELHAATVIEDANLSWGAVSINNPSPVGPDANYGATIFQDAGASDHTSAWFYYDGGSIRGVTENLDEGSDWYVVSEGQALTKQAIQQGLAIPLFTFGPNFHPPVSLVTGQDIFLGVVSGQGFGPDDRDVFGWVRLRPSAGFPPIITPTLTMIDNVMSYGSQGIIVGTSTVVPEPSSVCLALFGVALICSSRRRRSAA